MFRMVGYRLQPPLQWFNNTFVRLRLPCLSEIEQEEERRLEAMLHWHDPTERLRMLHRRCHTHTLVDDNPASG